MKCSLNLIIIPDQSSKKRPQVYIVLRTQNPWDIFTYKNFGPHFLCKLKRHLKLFAVGCTFLAIPSEFGEYP